jgi:protein arginine kinase
VNNLDFARILIKHVFHVKTGQFIDTVFSTQVGLIRNIYNIPFSHRQKTSDYNFIKFVIQKFVNESIYKGLTILDISSLDNNNKRLLREENFISHNMEITENSFVILSDSEDFIILVNDEDHFKIQITKPGLELTELYNIADEVDNELNKFAVYAFSENYGYITSNSSNSGLEVSVMMHLPALIFTKRIIEARDIVKLSRLNIEGLRQDGLKTFGGMFILSNGYTRGIPEMELLEEFKKVTNKIINLESEARESYFAEHSIKLEDRIYRSFGILKYARRLSYVESMDLLSDIRLGIILSIIKNIELQRINDLMINTQWAHMQKIADKMFNDTIESDIFRASYLRDQIDWSFANG